MATVELVYDAGCPHVAAARAELLRAFAAAGAPPRWREWRGDDPEAPPHVRGHGSPTILVAGRDVAAAETAGSACCRLYRRADGSLAGAPSAEAIARALRGTPADDGRATVAAAGGWRLGLAALPGIGAALLPKVACPACWPAYAGFASAVGAGFLLDTRYLLPLTAVFLAVAVAALAFRAPRRRGYGPFAVGLVAAAAVLAGKFVAESDAATYSGLALLVAASLWNGWPRRPSVDPCPSCVGEPPIRERAPNP